MGRACRNSAPNWRLGRARLVRSEKRLAACSRSTCGGQVPLACDCLPSASVQVCSTSARAAAQCSARRRPQDRCWTKLGGGNRGPCHGAPKSPRLYGGKWCGGAVGDGPGTRLKRLQAIVVPVSDDAGPMHRDRFNRWAGNQAVARQDGDTASEGARRAPLEAVVHGSTRRARKSAG